MKIITRTLFFVSTIILLTDCKKFSKTYEGYFYTDIENSSGPLFLYIDDKYKGELPNLKTTLSTDNDTIINNALHLSLRSGKYKIVGKDGQGNVKSSGTLTFRLHSESGSSTIGGQATYMNVSSRTVFAHKVYYQHYVHNDRITTPSQNARFFVYCLR